MLKTNLRRILHLLYGALLCLAVASCGSTKENNARTRFWQAFVTRYNTYHNGHEAYKEGLQAQENGHMDNYMYPIHLFYISSPTTQKTGTGNFDTAIEKAQKATKLHSIKAKPKRKGGDMSEKEKAFYAKKEFNPFMHNVWLLMANAQFQKGEFLEAATTFAYTARLFSDDPKVVAECRMHMAQCYAELDWTYEAENLFAEAKRDSIPYQLADEYEALYASYLLEHERFEEALPHLEKAVKRSGRTKKQRAREYYLLGQIYTLNGQNDNAYHAYQKVLRQNPPYQLEFNARIQQTEVVTGKTAPKLIKSLKRMTKDPNNKDYLDQVYYAMGNIYMAQTDTLTAIRQYEKGAELSTRGGIEKGVLLLHLGNIYWERGRYSDAQRCYAGAVGLIDKESKEYPQLNKRSSILDGLVEHTNVIALQDSLQALAKLPEEELYKVIDKIIEEVILKEAEEKEKAEEEQRKARRDQILSESNAGKKSTTPQMTGGDNSWYFYNTLLVNQGKTDFQEKWGRRKLEDNWRRSNKSVLAEATFEETDYSDSAVDSTATETTVPDSAALAARADSLANDIHNRMYYIKQIPLTEPQLAESNKLLSEALFGAGVVYKDKLEDFTLAESDFGRLMQQFPDYPDMVQVYYHLYLMYSRWGKADQAEEYKKRLTEQFADSEFALIVNDPEFKEKALYGKHREDSLYAATYEAYNAGDFGAVHAANAFAAEKYPMGAHRPKFMFFDAMSTLQEGDQAKFLEELKEVVGKYPQNEISELAGLIAQGMQEGRLLTSTSLGTIWNRRLGGAADAAAADAAAAAKPFTDDRYAPFIFMLAYEEGTVNDNQLLFEMARYNFTKFMVRNFEITTDKKGGIAMLRVSGFMNFDEAWHYHRRLYADNEMSVKLSGIRSLIISESNLALLLESHSFDEYAAFYDEHFGQLQGLEETDDSMLDDVRFDDSDEEEEPAEKKEEENPDKPDF